MTWVREKKVAGDRPVPMHLQYVWDANMMEKTGEINITVCENNVYGIRIKFPFRPLTYALTRNSTAVEGMGEDDVLFAKALPNFDDTLSAEDSERICSYPLPIFANTNALDYFCKRSDWESFNKQLRSMLFHSLFAPGNYVAGEHSKLT